MSEPEIDYAREYSFREAARFFQSPYGGGAVALASLHRWRLQGRLKAFARQHGGRRYWYVTGAAVLELLGSRGRGPDVPPAPPPRGRGNGTASERYLRAKGVLPPLAGE